MTDERADAILREIKYIRRMIVALTTNQQRAINSLAESIHSLSASLTGVLESVRTARADLQRVTDEEGREEDERIRLEKVIATMDDEIVAALDPIIQQVGALDSSLQSPASPDQPLTVQESK